MPEADRGAPEADTTNSEDDERREREGRAFGFIKFTRALEHAEQFLDGRLHMNPGSYFRKCEAGSCDVGDNREGTYTWLNRDAGYRIQFGIPQPDGSTKMHTIEPHEWADHAALSLSDGNDVKLFCVTALRSSDTQPRIDALVERWRREYPFAVVMLQPRELCSRFIAAVKNKGWTGRCRQVDYFDPDVHDGELRPPWFCKRMAFDWQAEWRFLAFADGKEAITFDIGTVRDICTPPIDLRGGAQLEFETPESNG